MKKKITDEEIINRFLSLRTVYDLSLLIKINYEDIWIAAEKPLYRSFYIPKKKGGFREIEAPHQQLKSIQKHLNFYLQKTYNSLLPESSHGFIVKHKDADARNIRSNASLHLNKKHVLNIDLKDFFHSVSASRVRYLFMSEPFNFERELATCMALLCCFNKRLPMGAATSPVLSNFVCIDLDKRLRRIADNNKLNYSRFADDLTFSTDNTISDKVITEIKIEISNHGFRINTDKFRLQRNTNKQSVTGIKVNKKLNVERTYIRNIRAVLHDIEMNGMHKAGKNYFNKNDLQDKWANTFYLSLKGKINFVGFVRGKDDDLYKRLKNKFVMLFDLEYIYKH